MGNAIKNSQTKIVSCKCDWKRPILIKCSCHVPFLKSVPNTTWMIKLTNKNMGYHLWWTHGVYLDLWNSTSYCPASWHVFWRFRNRMSDCFEEQQMNSGHPPIACFPFVRYWGANLDVHCQTISSWLEWNIQSYLTLTIPQISRKWIATNDSFTSTWIYLIILHPTSINSSGQIIIFHQPRFPWNKGSHFPSLATF